MDHAADILHYLQHGLESQGGNVCEMEVVDRNRARALIFGKDQHAWVTVEIADAPGYLYHHPSPWPRGKFFNGPLRYEHETR